MSHIEESPLSDAKMDISETTNSQESLGISPDIEQPNLLDTNIIASTTTDDLRTTTQTKTEPKTNNTTNGILEKSVNHDQLDNRNEKNDLINNRNSGILTTRSSTLTLANSHPLMSPAGNDSDNELKPTYFDYPDIIPRDEPLRLNGPPLSGSFTDENTASLDILSNREIETWQRRKISILPLDSSSDSEPDVSQYQATVEPSLQSVSLIQNSQPTGSTSSRKLTNAIQSQRRSIPIDDDLLSDDNVSSIDTISNQSLDDNIINQLISVSLSSTMDDPRYSDGNAVDPDLDLDTPSNLPLDPIPQYTAVDEARDSRNWQKITLPDGRIREIDMKVIEPYKRVLSHGGYLNSGGHNAIVLFSACYLPDRSRADYHYVMDNLFLYVVKTLEQLVTEDYVLIYLHGGSSRSNVPTFPWLKKCYQLLDRRLRKSLKNLFMVHPTFWLKSVVWMARPFISSKFWRKLIYIRTLDELYQLVPPIEKAAIPEKVKKYDIKYT